MKKLLLVFQVTLALLLTSCKAPGNYHIVTFDSNGGTSIPSQKVSHGEKANKPEDPIKEGYHLDKWMYGLEEWSFVGYVVTEDMTLVASWLPNEYTIKLINHDYESTETVLYDSEYSLYSASYTGLNFAGWFTEPYCEGEQITDKNGTPFNTKYTYSHDLTLYAGFTYTVSFFTNGGSPIDSVTLKENEKLDNDIVAVREDSEFNGWYYKGNQVSLDEVNKNMTLEARWDGESNPNDFTYSQIRYGNNPTIRITGYKGNDVDVVIPRYIDGSLVVSIGSSAFIKNNIVESVTLPNGVTKIERYAFGNCANLKHINVPESLESIDYDYIYNCASLEFNKYDNGLYLGNVNNPYVALIDKSSYEIETIEINSGCRVMRQIAFSGCKKLVSVNILGNLIAIPYRAFYGCTSLASINIPNSVASIGIEAFSGCSSLASISLLSNIEEIYETSFEGCSSLVFNEFGNCKYLGSGDNPYFYLIDTKDKEITSCIINEECKLFAKNVFSNCPSLASITIPYIGDGKNNQLFGYIFGAVGWNEQGKYVPNSLKEVTILEGITEIPYYAFYSCSSIETINIPTSVTKIGVLAFGECSSLASFTISSNVTSIGENPFYYCGSLLEINVDSNNKNYCSIDGVLFTKDKTTIVAYPGGKEGGYVIPSYVNKLDYSSFAGSTGLTSVILHEGIKEICAAAFYGCDSLKYNEYNSGSYIGTSDNPYFALALVSNYDIASFTVHNSCKHILDFVFGDFKNLKNIALPDGLLTIGDGAFWSCTALTSISIPSSVINIGADAFYSTTHLLTIDVDPNNQYYSSQDGVLFNKDKTLLIQFPGGKEGTYIVPSSVTTIDYRAFQEAKYLSALIILHNVSFSLYWNLFVDCTKLTYVVLPSGIGSMNNCFYGNDCLASIYFLGSSDEWASIMANSPSDAKDLENVKVYYYSETEPTSSGNYWRYVDNIPTPWN